MALSDKSLHLLKQIYAHRGRGEEQLVDEDADEALEYVLQKIVKTLSDRHRKGAPLYRVIHEAVGGYHMDWSERPKAKPS